MASNEVSMNLKKLENELESRYLAPAMNKACALVRNDAIQKAPHRTGALQRSIDFQVSTDGTEGIVYSDIEYAPYVEVGTGIYATKGGGRDTPWTYEGYDGFVTTRGNKAQPFLEPALQQNTTKIADCFKGIF